jgi:proteasome component ECM29
MTATTTTVTSTVDTLRLEFASLQRVFHRVALIDTAERLSSVLDKLLPRLLQRIGDHVVARNGTTTGSSNNELAILHEQIHGKLVEILNHVMKRVREDAACLLPVLSILDLLLLTSNSDEALWRVKNVDSLTLNLSLTFASVGLPRVPYPDLALVLPRLVVLLGATTPTRPGTMIAHLVLRTMVRLVTELSASDAASLDLVRQVLLLPAAAAALYDLLLDVLLYQPVAGSLPPAGLSQRGHERLRDGPPVVTTTGAASTRNWGHDMAIFSQLEAWKRAVLDWISPVRPWHGWTITLDQPTVSTLPSKEAALYNQARMISLLVVATGDPASASVRELAETYLRIHLERKVAVPTTNQPAATKVTPANMLGQPQVLAIHLLNLCLGQTHADAVLAQFQSANGGAWNAVNLADLSTLGSVPDEDPSVNAYAAKRRPIHDTTKAAVIHFVATRVLDEFPNLLLDDRDAEQETTSEDAMRDITPPKSPQLLNQLLGATAAQVCLRTLSSLPSSMGLTRIRARPYSDAALLLCSLATQWTRYYDNNDDDRRQSLQPLVDLLSSLLATACLVVKNAFAGGAVLAASPSTTTGSEGSMAIRDSCYVAISTLCRSSWASQDSRVFSLGASREATTSMPSTETAALLFACAANEMESLRPRAVAALDALLASYVRLYVSTPTPPVEAADGDSTMDIGVHNPWASAAVETVARPSQVAATSATEQQLLAQAILPLIWSASRDGRSKSSRVAAARWSNDLVKKLDLAPACHVLCFLAGDTDVTAAAIARDGLDASLVSSQFSTHDAAAALPNFSDLVALLFVKDDALSRLAVPTFKFVDFSPKGQATSLRFCLKCLLEDVYGGEERSISIYLGAVCAVLDRLARQGSNHSLSAADSSTMELVEEAAFCLNTTLSTSAFARRQVASGETLLSLDGIESLSVKAPSPVARRYLAATCGALFEDMSLWGDESNSSKPLAERLSRTLQSVPGFFGDESRPRQNAVSRLHGSVYLIGHVIRACRNYATRGSAPALEESVWVNANQFLSYLGRNLVDNDESVGNTCSNVLGVALSYNGIDAPPVIDKLAGGFVSSIQGVSLALRKYGISEDFDPTRALSLARTAGTCLGATSAGLGDPLLQSARYDCVSTLVAMIGANAFRKDEEIALVVGESLALFCDVPSSYVAPQHAIDWIDGFDESFARALQPTEHVLFLLLRMSFASSSPQKRTGTAPALMAVVARGTRGAIHDRSYGSRHIVKSLISHLEEVQGAFIALLADPKSKQLSRESCCLGLAACRGLTECKWVESLMLHGRSSASFDQRLLTAFGQTSNHGVSAMIETQAQAADRRAREREEANGRTAEHLMEQFGVENEVGGTAGMGEASLSAYREMASASVSIGRPDILYSLLILCVSHPVWSSGTSNVYNAASLLGSNLLTDNLSSAAEIRVALRPHMGKLIPRLLRACNDPNKQTRDQMTILWLALAGGKAESSALVTQNLLTTVDILLVDCSSKLWRCRVGACGALSDVLGTTRWFKLQLSCDRPELTVCP